MKKTFTFLALTLIGSYGFAQHCDAFIPWNVGKKITTENYDGKNKLTGTTTNKVLSLNDLADKSEAVVEVENFDKKGVSQGKGELKYYCKGETFEIDMKSFLPQEQMAGFKDMTIEFTTDNMAYPKVMTAGTTLKSGFVEAIISNQGMKFMTMRVDVTNIKVEAVESITVPAGTYTAYKITSDVTSKSGFVTVNFKSVQWMVVGIGAVKTETYDKKGNLIASSLITKIE